MPKSDRDITRRLSALTDALASSQSPPSRDKVDLWKIIVGIFGILVPLFIAYQNVTLTKDLERIRNQISESQLNITRSQFAAGLMEPLIKGSESERLTAMIVLESAADSLAAKIFAGLALHDPNVKIRLEAIRALGRKGVGEATKQTLTTIQQRGKTEIERKAAGLANKDLSFRENLRIAKVFFDQGRWESAVQYYIEASQNVDSTQIDIPQLIAATSYYTHGGHESAAAKFDSVFSKFY